MKGQDGTGDLRENPPTCGIARHDCHMRKSGSEPAWELNRLRLGGRRAKYEFSTTARIVFVRQTHSACAGVFFLLICPPFFCCLLFTHILPWRALPRGETERTAQIIFVSQNDAHQSKLHLPPSPSTTHVSPGGAGSVYFSDNSAGPAVLLHLASPEFFCFRPWRTRLEDWVRDHLDPHAFYDSGIFQIEILLADSRPVLNVALYSVAYGVRLTNITMVSGNTETNETGVYAAMDIGELIIACLECLQIYTANYTRPTHEHSDEAHGNVNLRTAEECTMCIQADIKHDFQKCSFHSEQLIVKNTDVKRLLDPRAQATRASKWRCCQATCLNAVGQSARRQPIRQLAAASSRPLTVSPRMRSDCPASREVLNGLQTSRRAIGRVLKAKIEWGLDLREASTEQSRKERATDTGDPRENPPISGIVRYDENPGVTSPGIEPGLPERHQPRPPGPPYLLLRGAVTSEQEALTASSMVLKALCTKTFSVKSLFARKRVHRLHGGHGGCVVSLLASHQDDMGSIPGRVTPDFRMWKSCRTMPLVSGFSRGSPVSPTPSFLR
ncbi:hypothetical protein PR048_010018 [Dryococelus australis]|uniref:Uncharacterized protein n=1 Tax=Dryococelus australis TaxID=614101 RepID=A0ABQ9I1L2_9NEOP|nr:hypothetical protein PR048_010018 [Dryococelus australis]